MCEKDNYGDWIREQIGEPTFIRVTYLQNVNIEVEMIKREVYSLFKNLFIQKIIDIHEFGVKDSILIMGKFKDYCLFNISVASKLPIQSPVLKIEIVGKNGMLQHDSSTESAFSGTYKLSLLKNLLLTISQREEVQ